VQGTAPAGWVTRSFGPVSLATPPTWAPIVLADDQVVTDADLDDILREQYLEDLRQPDVLAALVDTETLGAAILEAFITGMYVGAHRNDLPFANSEELAAFAREQIYSGPDAPSGVEITVFAHATAPAIQARYMEEQDNDSLVIVEYTIVFPDQLVFLDFATAERNPDPDIATADQIARTVVVG
jgi:hypothetical protein